MLNCHALHGTQSFFMGNTRSQSLSSHRNTLVYYCRIEKLWQIFETTEDTRAHLQFFPSQNIDWKFNPEHPPTFGGLWEAAVKSIQTHLRRIISNIKLTLEELFTVLTQVKACLNSHPLVPTHHDGIDFLTPGHFLIGKPLESLPDPAFSSVSNCWLDTFGEGGPLSTSLP